MRKYGVYNLSEVIPQKRAILEHADIISNINLFNLKQLKKLAGNYFIPNRSHMNKSELKTAIVETIKNTDHGADTLDGLFLEGGYDENTKKNYPIMTVAEYVKCLNQ